MAEVNNGKFLRFKAPVFRYRAVNILNHPDQGQARLTIEQYNQQSISLYFHHVRCNQS